jgi:hypothetical protein
MLILRSPNVPAHPVFKDLADRRYGLHSIYLTEDLEWKPDTDKRNRKAVPGLERLQDCLQYLGNVIVKMNQS